MLKPEISFKVVKPEWDGLFLHIGFMGNECKFDLSGVMAMDKAGLVVNTYILVGEYLNSLPYAVVKEYFDTVTSIEKMDNSKQETRLYLSKLVNSLVGLIDYENLKKWMRVNKHRVYIEPGMVDTFQFDPDLNTTRSMTYTTWDYLDLISLTLVFRMVLPVYLDYFRYNLHTNSQLCNFIVYSLFEISEISTSDEVEKLRDYIRGVEAKNESRATVDTYIISKGLSSDDMTDNTLAVVMFTKLLGNDFINKESNIISFIYNTVKYRSAFNPADETYRDKGGVSASVSVGEEPKSVLEEFRSVPPLSQGIIAEIQQALDDVESVLFYLRTTFDQNDWERYNYELSKIHILQQHDHHPVQIQLLGLMLNGYAPHQILQYMDERKILELLILAKIVLWKKGHFFLAVLMTSYINTREAPQMLSVKTTVTKNTIEPLLCFYKNIVVDNRIPIIEENISEIARTIVSTPWVPTSTDIELQQIKSPSHYLAVPFNLIELLVAFIAETLGECNNV